MKKRILCAIMALLLVIPTILMTGCKKEENVVVIDGSDATPMTITLYSIVEGDSVDESVRASIEAAINEITEFEFNTHIILKLFTEEEYHDKLYADLEEAAANYTEIIGATVNVEETKKLELATDENGETKYVEVRKADVEYPEENGTQVDIFLINSIDQYNRHVSNNELRDLTANLLPGTDFAILNKYINSTLMKGVTLANSNDNKLVYAIPNNHVIGEYEYFLVRKDLAEGIQFTGEGFTPTMVNIESLLCDLKLVTEPMDMSVSFSAEMTVPKLDENGNEILKEDGTPETEVVPAEDPAPQETATLSNDSYTFVYDTYGVEPKYESLGGYYGYYYGGENLSTDASTKGNAINLADAYVSDYVSDLAYISKYFSNEVVEGTEPACMFVKGPSTIKTEYEDDYVVVTYKAPVANNDTVYNAMYGISGLSDDARTQRCLEIITYMQTNQEFANIFRYGVENVNYEKDENNIVTILNDDYRMKPEYAGNMFLHYSNTSMTDYERLFAYDNWALAKEQNLNETYYSPYLGYSARTTEINVWTINEYADDSKYSYGPYTPEEIMDHVENRSAEYKAIFDKYVGAEKKAIFSKYADEFTKDDIMDIALGVNDRNSPRMRYLEWYNQNYPAPEAEQ